MSFLFHRKTQKVMKYIWSVIAVIIIIGMALFFAPGITNLIAAL
ncbi:MAG: hypothetical protein JWO50_284 [Candidatus Kaiserbacteria bacterium]|nr:hypothetical protein [Candidatus Kaiserbacteria bacterium]